MTLSPHVDRMRIGIDATALPPRPVGAGNYIIHFTRALAQQTATEHPDSELVIFVQNARQSLLAIEPSARVNVVSLPDQSPLRRLAWEQMALPGLIRHYRLDLLHSLHYTMPGLAPCPVIVTFHDMTFFLFPHLHILPKRIFFQNMIRFSARRAAALLAVSESTRQDSIRLLGLTPERITTTPLGVTSGFTPVRDRARLDVVCQKYRLPERFVLYVGLLEPRKNLPALLRAFGQISDRFPGHQLVLVGRQGWMVEQVFELVESLGLKERVCFTGYVESEDLPALYSLADVFVYPTFYEGFGLPVLEAMACGAPVITSRVSSLPEIAGDAGVLLDPEDETQLAGALERLLRDPAERVQRAARGLELARAFTWDRTARLTWPVYDRIFSKIRGLMR